MASSYPLYGECVEFKWNISIWTGAMRDIFKPDKQFYWPNESNLTLADELWNENEPTPNSEDKCARMRATHSYKFFDRDCSFSFFYRCEK